MLEHPKKHKYLIGNNFVIWDDQQERLVSVPLITDEMKWYIAGFVDGEGSFCLNIKNHKASRHGFKIDPAFYVYQHEKSRWLLELLKINFQSGSIHRKSDPSTVLTYQIAGIRPCFNKVLPFFEKYPVSIKQESFQLFSEAINMMFKKEHLTNSGKIEIVEIAYKLNQIGKGKKWEKDELISRILRGYTLNRSQI